jgi:hypothetical protein
MRSAANQEQIDSLKAAIESSRLNSAALARELQMATTEDERARIGHLHAAAVQHTEALGVLLAIAEQRTEDSAERSADTITPPK